jgi:hypothetical protein
MRVPDDEHVLVAERELELGFVAVEDPRGWVVKGSVRCDHAAIHVPLRERVEDRAVLLGQRLPDRDDAWAMAGDVPLVEPVDGDQVVISGDDDVAGAEREFDRLVWIRIADEVAETPDRLDAHVVRVRDRSLQRSDIPVGIRDECQSGHGRRVSTNA